MRLRLVVQYDGGPYHGWQVQDDVPTVCGELIKAFSKMELGKVEPVAAGRTDAGVHAWGQVVHVDVDKLLKIERYLTGLNRFLPDEIRIVEVTEVGEDFHARFGAKSRHYRYLLWDGRQLRPDLVGRAGHSRHPVDVEKMAQALEIMGVGEMDFSAFRDAECQSRTPMCDLHYAKIMRDSNGLVVFEVGANHFLHHMVRNMVGTLVEIGTGKREVTGMKEVLDGKDRTKAGATYAPSGLYMVRVEY